MGQYWKFIAPGKWQCLRRRRETKMPEFVFESETSQWLASLLIVRDPVKSLSSEPPPLPTSRGAQPCTSSKALSQAGLTTTKDAQEASRSSSALLSLPVELQIMIIGQLSNYSKITLGVACTHLWHLVVSDIHNAMLRRPKQGSWVGVPLVFVGDYTNADGYPPEIQRLMEEENLGQEPAQGDHEEEEHVGRFVDYQQKPQTEGSGENESDKGSFDWSSSSNSSSISDDEDEDVNARLTVSMSYMDRRYKNIRPWRFDDHFNALRKHYLEVSGALTPQVFDASITPDNFIPKDRPWILRNLTTRQFIHATSVALDPSHINGPYIEKRGFGNVLAIRTGWSQDPSISMSDYSIHGLITGPWAGHRFDIITLRMHEEQIGRSEGNEEVWEDISTEIKDELDCVWNQ